MKLTKLVHACLIAEQNQRRILVDPGSYSWQSGIVDSDLLRDISAAVVTHAHPDHLNKEFVAAVNQASPSVKWYGPEEVVQQLVEWGYSGLSSNADDDIVFVNSAHADLSPWFGQQPEHTSFILFGELLIGGDCHTLKENHGARVFAGAVNGGPWGGVVGYAKMIEAMSSRPEIVVPLHDWHWNDTARQGIYAQLPEVMSKFDVSFVPLENGVATEV